MSAINLGLAIDLDRLQSFIRNESITYKEEFHQQFVHYKAYYQMLLQNPNHESRVTSKLILFLSNVIHFYEEYSDEFRNGILGLLRKFSDVLNPVFTLVLVKSIVMMRNNKVISINEMVELFFQLFSIQNKSLRSFIFTQLIVHIRKFHNNRNTLNSPLQTFFYLQLSEPDRLTEYLATEITIELFNKNIWKNSKSVFLIQSSVFSKVKKISVNSVRFFINPVYENASDESSEEEEEDYSDLRNRKRKRKQAHTNSKNSKCCTQSFYAIDLIRDPFDFTSKLMKLLENKRDSFDHLLEKMSLIGLLIWSHKLLIPQFYTFIQSYLKPKQQQVTRILTYLSQAVHEDIECKYLESPIEAIVSNFITDRNSPETITVGLNTIREIAFKCPHVLTSELLSDLVQYRKCKNKNVIMAARSLLQLYRHLEPGLLEKKERGKPNEFEFSNLSNDLIPGIMSLDSNLTASDILVERSNELSDPRAELAREISQSRILTQSDHETMKRKRAEQLLNPKLSNRQLQLNYRMMKEKRDILTVSEIEHLSNKPKGIQEEKSDVIKSKLKLKTTQKSGLSKNKTRKNKNYMMVCHGKGVAGKKIRAKKKSFQAKNYKLKRILRKEYRKMKASET